MPMHEPETFRRQFKRFEAARSSFPYECGRNAAMHSKDFNDCPFTGNQDHILLFQLGYIEYCEQHNCIGRTLFDTDWPSIRQEGEPNK